MHVNGAALMEIDSSLRSIGPLLTLSNAQDLDTNYPIKFVNHLDLSNVMYVRIEDGRF